MKRFKIIKLISLFMITNLNLIACGNNYDFLEITNEDIYDDDLELSKLDKLANWFLFTEPKKSKCDKELSFNWNLSNRKKIIGKKNCSYSEYEKLNKKWINGWEYWIINIQKTKNKGLYVFNYQMTNEKPLDWEN